MNFDAFSNPSIVANLNLGNRVTVQSINMIETGTYNPLFSRNYTLNSSVSTVSDMVNSLSDRVSQSMCSVTPDLVAGVSSNLISQSPEVGPMLSIPNGWDLPRFRYNMRVRVDLTSGLHEIYDVQGYSEYLDVSHTNRIDPNMKMYINSITRVSEYQDQFGQTSLTSSGSSQIVNGAIAATPNSSGVFTMRPRDVLTEIQWQYLQEDAGTTYLDGRANITGKATGSTRTNAVPAIYLSELLGNWLDTVRDNDIANDKAVVSGTLNRLQENFYEENKLIRELVRVQGIGNGGYFTMATLSMLDKTFEINSALMSNRLNVMLLGGATNQDTVTIGAGSNWNGRDIEAIWASSLAQSVPAIMSRYFVGKFAFTSTNMTIHGDFVTETVNMKSANQALMNIQVARSLCRDVENLVMKDLTMNNLIKYNLSGEFDCYGDTKIVLGIEGRPPQTFFMPSFADSISTPVLTSDKRNLSNLALGMESVVRTVVDNVLSPSSDMLPTIVADF